MSLVSLIHLSRLKIEDNEIVGNENFIKKTILLIIFSRKNLFDHGIHRIKQGYKFI